MTGFNICSAESLVATGLVILEIYKPGAQLTCPSHVLSQSLPSPHLPFTLHMEGKRLRSKLLTLKFKVNSDCVLFVQCIALLVYLLKCVIMETWK